MSLKMTIHLCVSYGEFNDINENEHNFYFVIVWFYSSLVNEK